MVAASCNHKDEVVRHLLFHKSLIDDEDDGQKISRYIAMINDEEGALVIEDEVERAIYVALKLAVEEKFDPWNIDLVEFSQLYMRRIQEEKTVDLVVAGRILFMAWCVLKMQTDTLLQRAESTMEDTCWGQEYDDEEPDFLLCAGETRSEEQWYSEKSVEGEPCLGADTKISETCTTTAGTNIDLLGMPVLFALENRTGVEQHAANISGKSGESESGYYIKVLGPGGEPLTLRPRITRSFTRKVTLMELVEAFDEVRQEAELQRKINDVRARLRRQQKKTLNNNIHQEGIERDIDFVWQALLEIFDKSCCKELRFIDVLGYCKTRYGFDLVTTFIALLFLTKNKKIWLLQPGFPFGDIIIKIRDVSRTSGVSVARLPAGEGGELALAREDYKKKGLHVVAAT